MTTDNDTQLTAVKGGRASQLPNFEGQPRGGVRAKNGTQYENLLYSSSQLTSKPSMCISECWSRSLPSKAPILCLKSGSSMAQRAATGSLKSARRPRLLHFRVQPQLKCTFYTDIDITTHFLISDGAFPDVTQHHKRPFAQTEAKSLRESLSTSVQSCTIATKYAHVIALWRLSNQQK